MCREDIYCDSNFRNPLKGEKINLDKNLGEKGRDSERDSGFFDRFIARDIFFLIRFVTNDSFNDSTHRIVTKIIDEIMKQKKKK